MPDEDRTSTPEQRSSMVLAWLSTEFPQITARHGFRRRRKTQSSLSTFTHLLQDGILISEVLVQLDAMPHAAILRAPKRPASTPDAKPAIDTRQTAQFYKQNTRRVVKVLTRVLEHLLREKLPPGTMQAYFGADVASTKITSNPLPAIKLVELVITAAMYGPESERYVWSIWHMPSSTTKTALHATVARVAEHFNLVSFERIVEQSTEGASLNEQMGSRKISLVTDDGKPPAELTPDCTRQPPSTAVPNPDPIRLVHPDHHDVRALASSGADPALMQEHFAYHEANARLQEVARARALVTRLEGSVLGAQRIYRKKETNSSETPAEPPPSVHGTEHGPLPTFSSFQGTVEESISQSETHDRVQPPVVSLPDLDGLTVQRHEPVFEPEQSRARDSLDDLATVENVVSSSSSDEDRDDVEAETSNATDEPSDTAPSDSESRQLSGTVLFSSAVTVPSGSTDNIGSGSHNVSVEPLIVPSQSLLRNFSGPITSSPIVEEEESPLPPEPEPEPEPESSAEPMTRGSASPLPPMFLSHDRVREENLSRAAAGQRQSFIAKPPPPSTNSIFPLIGPSAVVTEQPEEFTEPEPEPEEVEPSSEPLVETPLAHIETAEESINEPLHSESEPLPATPQLHSGFESFTEFVPGTYTSNMQTGKVPSTPPSPPAISDVVASFAVKTPDRPRALGSRVVSTMSPSPKLFQKLISVWQKSSDGSEEYANESAPSAVQTSRSADGTTSSEEPLPVADDPPPEIDAEEIDDGTKSTDVLEVDEQNVVTNSNKVTDLSASLELEGKPDNNVEHYAAVELPNESQDLEPGEPGEDAKILRADIKSVKLNVPAAGELGNESDDGPSPEGDTLSSSSNRRRAVRLARSPIQVPQQIPDEIRKESEFAPADASDRSSHHSSSQTASPAQELATSSFIAYEQVSDTQRLSATHTERTLEPPSSEVTNSTASAGRQLNPANDTESQFTETQMKRLSRESQQAMSSPSIADSPRQASSNSGDGIEVEGGSVRVDKRRLDWLTQELLAARDAIKQKDLDMHMTEKEKSDEKEVLILQKQDAESVVAAMKQILAEREGELREARKRLSMAIAGSSKRKSTDSNSSDIEARIQAEASKKAEVLYRERANVGVRRVEMGSSNDSKFTELLNRFEQSDSVTRDVAAKSHAEMTRLWGEVQMSMEEKMEQMINKRDRELAELKIELAKRQQVVDELQEARLNLVNQNAQVKAEADSAKQERELIITQAAMEISQVQAQLVLVDKFSKKLHDTFKETELLRAQVADSQATMASLANNNGMSSQEVREMKEALFRAQAEADRWRDAAEHARMEKVEAEHRAEKITRRYENFGGAQAREARYSRETEEDIRSYSSGRPSTAERYAHVQEQMVPTPSFHRDTLPDHVDAPRVAPPPPPEPPASSGSRMWKSIKNLVTGGQKASGKKPPRKPRDRRGARAAQPPQQEVEQTQEIVEEPYRSPQLSPRDFVTSYRYGEGREPSPSLSDRSVSSEEIEGSAQSPNIGLRERQDSF